MVVWWDRSCEPADQPPATSPGGRVDARVRGILTPGGRKNLVRRDTLRVTESPMEPTPAEPTGWLTLPDVAERLELPITTVRQLIREGKLLALRRDGVLRVPVELIA